MNYDFKGTAGRSMRSYLTDFELNVCKSAVVYGLQPGDTLNNQRQQDPSFLATVTSITNADDTEGAGWSIINVSMRNKNLEIAYKATPEKIDREEPTGTTTEEETEEPKEAVIVMQTSTNTTPQTETATPEEPEALIEAAAQAAAQAAGSQSRAEQAQAEADAAQQAAEAAAQQAAEAKQAAEQAQTEAAGKKADAAQAQTAAEQAQAEARQETTLENMKKALEAAQEAEQAQTEAEQAQAEADQAQTAAEQAQTEAEQAKQEAEEKQLTADILKEEAAQAKQEADTAQAKADEAKATPQLPAPTPAPEKKKLPKHPKFKYVLEDLNLGLIPYLYGPAGTGKNTCAEQVADALNVPFFAIGCVTMKYEIEGYKDANGVYQESDFYRAITQPSVLLIDEIDASTTEALKALNSLLANGYYNFPCGLTYKHPECRIIVAGNTTGRGTDQGYNAGNALDISTLDRFVGEEFKYSRPIELHAARGNEKIVDLAQEFRKAAELAGIPFVASPRGEFRLAALLSAGTRSIAAAIRAAFTWSLDPEDVKTIAAAIPEEAADTNELIAALKGRKNN